MISAQIYAESLFRLAKKHEQFEDMNEQFEAFTVLVENHPDWLTILDTPTIRNKKKKALIEETEAFSPVFVHFLMVLVRNHHIRYYKDIYEYWIGRVRLQQKVAYVYLYTAKPLSKYRMDKIRKEIQPFLAGLQIEFNVQIDKSLLKGIRIVHQGRSIERSLRRTLEDMQSSI